MLNAITMKSKKDLSVQRITSRPNRIKLILRGCLLPIIVITIWQFLSSQDYISEQLFSSPWLIAKEYVNLIASGELVHHLRISIIRALLGFLLGGGCGLLVGMLVGMYQRFEEYVNPTVQMLRTVPMVAITPLFIMWFGFGELSKILLISMGAFFPLYVNTFLGVRSMDAKLFDVVRVLEFSRYKQITKLVIPSALPNILLGIRLSLSIAWLCLVVAELLGADAGVGFMIQDARSFMQTDVIFVGITLFALVGILSDLIVRFLEKQLLRWRDSYNG